MKQKFTNLTIKIISPCLIRTYKTKKLWIEGKIENALKTLYSEGGIPYLYITINKKNLGFNIGGYIPPYEYNEKNAFYKNPS